VRLFQKEIIDGIRVNRVVLFPSHDRSGFKRIMNYLIFSLSAALLGPLLVRKPDVIYVYNLITLSWAALVMKHISGCKIVYDVQDLWPESVNNSRILSNRFLLNALNRWCVWAYCRADRLAVLSPGFKRALIERGVPRERIEVVYNWCDSTNWESRKRDNDLARECRILDTHNVVFAGTMGTMQGMDTVLEAARLCGHTLPDARFVLVGGGTEVERLKGRARDLGLGNVVFIPRQPMHAMDKIWSIADVLLVHLVDEPILSITIPSKTQAYLSTGVPVIMAVRGDAADLMVESGGGIVCQPENPVEMAAAVKQIYDMPLSDRKRMGQRGKQYYDHMLSIDRGCEKFLTLFS
jgi:glycosyltransferase involved in cell wall biosynthesis